MTKRSRMKVAIPVAVVALAAVVCWAGENAKITLERSAEWEKAASNREMAALICEEQARQLLEEAQDLRQEEYLEDYERQLNLRRAGDLEKSAGDYYARAVGNFDKAAVNWGNVAREYKKLRYKQKERQAWITAAVARKNALASCNRAALAYESACEAYGPENGAHAAKAAMGSEKAATWREKLASRK